MAEDRLTVLAVTEVIPCIENSKDAASQGQPENAASTVCTQDRPEVAVVEVEDCADARWATVASIMSTVVVLVAALCSSLSLLELLFSTNGVIIIIIMYGGRNTSVAKGSPVWIALRKVVSIACATQGTPCTCICGAVVFVVLQK